MARFARVVIPNIPHHIIQRGNRRQKVFFNDQDKKSYLNMLKKNLQKSGLEIWAYCLMDNHIHLVAVPKNIDSLARGIGETHKNYTKMINKRENWQGYLWQGRFKSYPLDEEYLYRVIRYVENNSVRARIVKKAEDYEWSSAASHVFRTKNIILCSENYLIDEIEDWAEYLSMDYSGEQNDIIKQHSKTERPLGNEDFMQQLETLVGRRLRKKKPGPKKKK